MHFRYQNRCRETQSALKIIQGFKAMLVDVFSRHGPFAFDRQLLLAELICDLDWFYYDVQTGLLSLGDRFRWHAEVLGTESDETATWLWAWANEAGNLPVDQQGAAFKLKALGQEYGIAELTEPMVPLGYADGHVFASVAVGEGLGKAYYRSPYEGGTAFLP